MTQKQDKPVDIFQACRAISKSKTKLVDLLELSHDEICHLIEAEANTFQEAEHCGKVALVYELIGQQPKIPLLKVLQDIEDAREAIQKVKPLAEPAGGSDPEPLTLDLVEI